MVALQRRVLKFRWKKEKQNDQDLTFGDEDRYLLKSSPVDNQLWLSPRDIEQKGEIFTEVIWLRYVEVPQLGRPNTTDACCHRCEPMS